MLYRAYRQRARQPLNACADFAASASAVPELSYACRLTPSVDSAAF